MATTHRAHAAQSVARDRSIARCSRRVPVARDQADSHAHLAPHRPLAWSARWSLHREARHRSIGRADGRSPLRSPGGPDAGRPHPLARPADPRDPGMGWLSNTWFRAVVGDDTAMALICQPDFNRPDEAWLVTDPTAVRRFVAAVEGELARPDPQLLAV